MQYLEFILAVVVCSNSYFYYVAHCVCGLAPPSFQLNRLVVIVSGPDPLHITTIKISWMARGASPQTQIESRIASQLDFFNKQIITSLQHDSVNMKIPESC